MDSGTIPLVSSTMAAWVALASTRRGQKSLEMQAVDQHHIGAGDRHRIGGLRLVDMGVAVGTDERRQLDPLAADIAGEVADDREAGNDLQRRGQRRAGG